MDRLPIDVSDDADLDALMDRVREAALGRASGGATALPQPGDATGRDPDLVRVIDAQAEWNEHASKSLAALVECLRALRDDWTEAQTGLRRDVGQLSALVEEMRTATEAAVARARPQADSTKRARRRSARVGSHRQPPNGRRRRS